MPLLHPPTPTAQRVLEQTLAAHRALQSGSAHIVISTQGPSGRQSEIVDLRYQRPDRVLLRTRYGGSDRSFLLRGSTLLAYDAATNEYLTRRGVKGPSLPAKLADVLGGIDQPIDLILSPSVLALWESGFGKTGWTVTRQGGTIAIAKGKAGASARLLVDSRSSLLRGGQFEHGSARLQWEVAYGPKPTTISLAIPPSAAKVETFRVQTRAIRYATPEARQVVQRMFRAGARLREGLVVASGSEGTVRMAFSRKGFHEIGPGLEWAFDGRTLTARRGHVLYRGPSRKSMLLDYVAAVGGRVDPFLRDLVTGSVPFQEFFSSGATASIGGQVGIGGLTCTIVAVRSERQRISLFVRPDGLVQSVSTDLLAPNGEMVATSARRFAYAPVPASTRYSLTVSPGDSVRPLPNVPMPRFRSK